MGIVIKGEQVLHDIAFFLKVIEDELVDKDWYHGGNTVIISNDLPRYEDGDNASLTSITFTNKIDGLPVIIWFEGDSVIYVRKGRNKLLWFDDHGSLNYELAIRYLKCEFDSPRLIKDYGEGLTKWALNAACEFSDLGKAEYIYKYGDKVYRFDNLVDEYMFLYNINPAFLTMEQYKYLEKKGIKIN